MKSLLIKDFYMIRKTALIMMGLGVLYVTMGALDPTSNMQLFSMFLFLFLAILPGTLLSLEEKSHWMELAVMLPFSRGMLVREKYVIGLIHIAIASLLCSLIHAALYALGLGGLHPGQELLALIAMGAGSGLVLIAVALPWMFVLGAAKGRIFMVGSVGLMSGLSVVLLGTYEGDMLMLMAKLGSWVPAMYVAAALMLCLLSMLISTALFRRKQIG